MNLSEELVFVKYLLYNYFPYYTEIVSV